MSQKTQVLPHHGSHCSCQATNMCRTGKGERLFSVSSHLSLQTPVSFSLLALFSVLEISGQVIKANIVFLSHRERKYYLLYITSICWTLFIHMDHTLYSSELSTEPFGKMHSKIHVFPIGITPRTSYATGSILDMALRE